MGFLLVLERVHGEMGWKMDRCLAFRIGGR